MGKKKNNGTVRRRGKGNARAENLDEVLGRASQVAGPTTQVQQSSRRPTPQPSSNESSDDGASGPTNDNGDDDSDSDSDSDDDDDDNDNAHENERSAQPHANALSRGPAQPSHMITFGPFKLPLDPGWTEVYEFVSGGFYYLNQKKRTFGPFNHVPVRNANHELLYYHHSDQRYVRPNELRNTMILHPQYRPVKDSKGVLCYISKARKTRVPPRLVPVRTQAFDAAYFDPHGKHFYDPVTLKRLHATQQPRPYTIPPQTASTVPQQTASTAPPLAQFRNNRRYENMAFRSRNTGPHAETYHVPDTTSAGHGIGDHSTHHVRTHRSPSPRRTDDKRSSHRDADDYPQYHQGGQRLPLRTHHKPYEEKQKSYGRDRGPYDAGYERRHDPYRFERSRSRPRVQVPRAGSPDRREPRRTRSPRSPRPYDEGLRPGDTPPHLYEDPYQPFTEKKRRVVDHWIDEQEPERWHMPEDTPGYESGEESFLGSDSIFGRDHKTGETGYYDDHESGRYPRQDESYHEARGRRHEAETYARGRSETRYAERAQQGKGKARAKESERNPSLDPHADARRAGTTKHEEPPENKAKNAVPPPNFADMLHARNVQKHREGK